MLVIDKPAGIAVHRGPKGGESLEDHFAALRFGLPRPPALAHPLDRQTPRGPKGAESLEDHFGALRFGLPRAPALAHRLDRETSGCLVLGRHRKALATLGRLFKSGAIGRG